MTPDRQTEDLTDKLTMYKLQGHQTDKQRSPPKNKQTKRPPDQHAYYFATRQTNKVGHINQDKLKNHWMNMKITRTPENQQIKTDTRQTNIPTDQYTNHHDTRKKTRLAQIKPYKLTDQQINILYISTSNRKTKKYT